MPKLVLPSIKYKKSFLGDFLAHTEMQDEYGLTGIPKDEVVKRFPEFIRKIKLQAKGVYPKKGLVPQTVLWLVDGNRFLGKLSIRHVLNSHLRKVGGHIGYYVRPDERGKGYGRQILALGLKKAKAMGLKKILITCDLTNLKSKKVIEGNGGKFASKVYMGRGLPYKLRFWIKT